MSVIKSKVTIEEVKALMDNGTSIEGIEDYLEEQITQVGRRFDEKLCIAICEPNFSSFTDYGEFTIGEVIDTKYGAFEASGRWSIPLYYYVRFNSRNVYCFSQDVGLTEMQESYWYDQIPTPVHQEVVTVTTWIDGEKVGY